MSKRLKMILAAGGAVVVAGLAAWFGVSALVRAKLASIAENRGLELEVARVRPGFKRIWLNDVRIASPEFPALRARVEQVGVEFGWTLSPKTILVRGGRVELVGTMREIGEQFRRFRGRRGAKRRSGFGRMGNLSYTVMGITVSQRDAPEAPPQVMRGLGYTRAPDGAETLTVDQLAYRSPGLSVNLSRARLSLRRHRGAALNSGRRIEQLQAEGLTTEVRLDRLLGVSVAKPGRKQERKQESARFGIDDERGPRLKKLVRWATQELTQRLEVGAQLSLSNLQALVQSGDQQVHLGPNRFSLKRSPTDLLISFRPQFEQTEGTPLELRATVPVHEGEVRVDIAGGPASLKTLGVKQGDFGLRQLERATLSAKGAVRWSADGKLLDFDGSAEFGHLSLLYPALSSAPLLQERLGIRGRGVVALDARRFELTSGELSFGDLVTSIEIALERDEEDLKIELSGGIPKTPCQTLLRAAPSGLLPSASLLKMSGSLGLKFSLSFDTRAPNQTEPRVLLENGCRIDAVPAELSPDRFSEAWSRTVVGADGESIEIESGPGSLDWVDYGDISPHMETAVIVCEDGRFFRHDGFDLEAIENSIKDNLKAGKFVRGASTISMQLAKNLYLSREKALSRKLEEAVFTLLLEQELSKAKLMELYLNVIEFGPGVYGIGPAAHHYFRTTPAELSLGQALYLASILPNPKQQHFTEDGTLSEGWSNYLRKLMGIALKIHRITHEEYEQGLAEQVTLRHPYLASNPFVETDFGLAGLGLEKHILPPQTETVRSNATARAGKAKKVKAETRKKSPPAL